MSRAWRSVSRFLLRIWIIVSCSMSLRFFLRVSMVSVSRVRPSASKALEGLKNSMAVWSSWVRDTVSSSRPFCERSADTTAAHALDVVAALLVHLLHGHLGGHGAQGIDELALHHSPSISGCMVRWPKVWAAAAIASAAAWTRT